MQRKRGTALIRNHLTEHRISLNASEPPKLDAKFEEITEGEELTKKEKLKTKWAALEALVGDPKRIALIAADLAAQLTPSPAGSSGCAQRYALSVSLSPLAEFGSRSAPRRWSSGGLLSRWAFLFRGNGIAALQGSSSWNTNAKPNGNEWKRILAVFAIFGGGAWLPDGLLRSRAANPERRTDSVAFRDEPNGNQWCEPET